MLEPFFIFRSNFRTLTLAISKYLLIFAMPNITQRLLSVEHPDRCSIRNWAFFMSIGIIFVTSRKW